jgi:hypothetical protein
MTPTEHTEIFEQENAVFALPTEGMAKGVQLVPLSVVLYILVTELPPLPTRFVDSR